MPKTYYELPTQVKFYDADSEEWFGGIAYQEYIICGCCGHFFEIESVLDKGAKENIAVPIIELPWIDISEEIKGE